MPNNKVKKIAIIGSHGLYANYGGWDQLVNNLAELKSEKFEYIIYNSSNTKVAKNLPNGVSVKKLRFKADGFQGFFFDFQSIFLAYFQVDVILLLGSQGMPLIPFLELFVKRRVLINIGGVEWERPNYNYFVKKYLRYCFKLSCKDSKMVILDNEYFKKFLPLNQKGKYIVIPYGGTIDHSLTICEDLIERYPFLKEQYFLSVSRSIEDNKIDELCESFTTLDEKLVLISNLSKSQYGKNLMKKYSNHKNIVLIDGLYDKPELDLVRRNCKAYIHTHTLCGTAPSLVEMIVSGKPILAIDNPQNRFTLDGGGGLFEDFEELGRLITSTKNFLEFLPCKELCDSYSWEGVVRQYESLY